MICYFLGHKLAARIVTSGKKHKQVLDEVMKDYNLAKEEWMSKAEGWIICRVSCTCRELTDL